MPCASLSMVFHITVRPCWLISESSWPIIAGIDITKGVVQRPHHTHGCRATAGPPTGCACAPPPARHSPD